MSSYPVEKWILNAMSRAEEIKIANVGEDAFVTNGYIGFLNNLLATFQRNYEDFKVVEFAKLHGEQKPVATAWFDKRLLIQALESLSDTYVKISLFEDGEQQYSIDLSTIWTHALVKGLDGNQMEEEVKTLYEAVLAAASNTEAQPEAKTKVQA